MDAVGARGSGNAADVSDGSKRDGGSGGVGGGNDDATPGSDQTHAAPAGSGAAAFKEVIVAVTRAAGDADTNGAVAGALAGCYLGYKKLPQEWVAQMPYAEWLEAHVQKLLFMLNLPTAPPP
jgi:hypothetical protein